MASKPSRHEAASAVAPSVYSLGITATELDPQISEQVIQGLDTSLDLNNVQITESIYSSIERGEFRLLELEYDVERPAIPSLRLRTASVASGKYVAVSYTWIQEEYCWYGRDLPLKTQLRINGKIFQLPSRIALILAMLFLVGVRTVWIDSICINQADYHEKGNQVASMNKIFKAASEVVIFLGKPTIKTDEILRVARDSPKWSALEDFLVRVNEGNAIAQHQYWYRAWILQEIARRRKVRRLFCGNIILSPEATDQVIGTLGSPFSIVSHEYTGEIYKVALCSLEDSWLSLPLLTGTRLGKCTDVRDAIYSKLGMTDDADILGSPDYTESPAKTFVRFAIAHIKRHKSLKILHHVEEHYIPNMPSWVPDWTPITREKLQYGYHYDTKLFTSMDWFSLNSQHFTAFFSEDWLELQVQGGILIQMPSIDNFRPRAAAYNSLYAPNIESHDLEAFYTDIAGDHFLCMLQGDDTPVILTWRGAYYTLWNEDRLEKEEVWHRLSWFWKDCAQDDLRVLLSSREDQSRFETSRWFKIR